jgi:hypothetical protein
MEVTETNTTTESSPDPPEVLLREAKRRSHIRRSSVIALTLVAAGLVALGVTQFGTSKPTIALPHAKGTARELAWQRARSSCSSQGMDIARQQGTGTTLVGSFPTTERGAVSWPPPPPRNANAFSTHRPAYICLFEGSFTSQFVCPSYDQSCRFPNESDLIVWLGTRAGPLVSVRDAFPLAPIPVAGS